MAEKVKIQDEKILKVSATGTPLWELRIKELSGHNIEAKGREEVNEMLRKGWILLYIYTLKYQEEDGVWRERPMVILGLPKRKKEKMS